MNSAPFVYLLMAQTRLLSRSVASLRAVLLDGEMYMSQEPVTKVGGPDEVTAKSSAQLVYILHAVGFFIGLTWIVAIIVNYVRQDEARGTWVESHFRWQIRTFWFGLLWGVIGVITSFIVVGFVVLAANYVWLIYRVVKGWLNFSERKPMYP